MGVHLRKKIKSKSSGLLSIFVLTFLLVLSACSAGEDTPASQAGEVSNDASSSSNGSGEAVTLSIAHFVPPAHHLHEDIVVPFSEEIEELTEGRVTFEHYPASALVALEAHYDMAVSGVADITISLQSYTPGKFPLSSVTELPFIGSSAVMGAEILWQLYQTFPEIQQEYEETKVLGLFANDAEYILTAKKPIEKLEDLKGLRIRTATTSENNTMEAWGASPSFMPMPDVYDALQRGVIDGAVAPLSTIESFGLADVVDYIIEGPFSVTNFFMVMNKEAWNKLSAEDREIVEQVAEKYRVLAAERYDKAGNDGRTVGIENGVEVITLADSEMERMRDSLKDFYQEWIDEMEAKGLPGEEIFNEALRLSQSYN